ncbi:DUF4173 domain-containing protein [Kitasatospora sp. CM 4170]|uniref:DUF4173 domain-containing protein n=1 Tax=Kitasatospora aburaviensis TaxID=67265 RepID=A0ABW1F2W7_9ACTN|nr:DUF4173 domain-containing protein [Kitasatospora sp. CM 4170]WNM47943.1 DUF4173 domain-containing protein [Kitasatospora sp. CM 4170]
MSGLSMPAPADEPSEPAASGVPGPGASGAGASGAGVPGPAGAGAPGAGVPGPAGSAAGFDPYRGPAAPADPYRPPVGPQPRPDRWLRPSDPPAKAPAAPRALLAALLTGLLAAWLMGDGLGVNLLICGAVASVGAGLAARSAGRKARPWTVLWSVLALALLAVPALFEAGWPVALATACALALASLALHGGRRWAGVLLALPGILWQLGPGLLWARDGLRRLSLPGRGKLVPVLKAVAVAAVLLTVFGWLFASADAAMADVMTSLSPSLDVGELPRRLMLFLLGLLTALGFAHIAAGPRRWDRTVVRPGRERGRLEWALPLGALNLMFGAFALVQAVVVLGGRDSIMENTGMSRSEYARQGFWQLMAVTVLTLVVVGVAKRWAPRSSEADRRLARILLGVLCLLTLVVVASALGRMWFYVDASGLTRLRLWVLVVEVWLGVVFLMLITAGLVRSVAWLPRAVVLSGMLTAAVYGLMGPDAIVAEQNVARFERTHQIDLRNVRDLSLDAVPALDRLPEDYRTCALDLMRVELADASTPWYATSRAAARARDIVAGRPLPVDSLAARNACDKAGLKESSFFDRY